jgi:polyhydroxybutyrate depolymerase
VNFPSLAPLAPISIRRLELPRRCGVIWAGLIFAVATVISFNNVQAATSREDSILINGEPRTFIVYTPDTGGTSLPVLILLHGGLGNGRYVANQTGLMNYVDRDRFIAVFPDGKEAHWNDGRSTMSAGPDDVAFLRRLITDVVQHLGGDPNRVFIAGISNGGMMAQRMACEASDVVKAIGAVVANMPADLVARCHPSRPIPVVLFNGTADRIMPWSGGSIATSKTFHTPGGEVVSAMDTFDFWSRHDGCTEKTTDTVPATHVERHMSKGCQAGAEVTLYAIEGGGHGWPGRVPQRPFERAIAGYVTMEISASTIIIQFFHQYGL